MAQRKKYGFLDIFQKLLNCVTNLKLAKTISVPTAISFFKLKVKKSSCLNARRKTQKNCP